METQGLLQEACEVRVRKGWGWASLPARQSAGDLDVCGQTVRPLRSNSKPQLVTVEATCWSEDRPGSKVLKS